MITCYAFQSVPPFARGLVRDLRVRWALEEAGIPYRTKLVGEGAGAMSREKYRGIQPFGQIPAIEDGKLVLFESGAIVLYVAERSKALLPADPAARAEVVQWCFTALNTIEFPAMELAVVDLFYPEEGWAEEYRPRVVEMIERRLGELAQAMKGREYFSGTFSAADILMATVLKILRHTDILAKFPALADYVNRCEARPAFQKALAAQLADLVDEPAAQKKAS